MDGRGEFGGVVAGQGHQQAVAQELEVDGVHAQLVGVQVAEGGQGTGQVVQVGHGGGQRISHLLAVGLDLGGAGAQVEVREVGLGGGEGLEGPVQRLSAVVASVATNLHLLELPHLERHKAL